MYLCNPQRWRWRREWRGGASWPAARPPRLGRAAALSAALQPHLPRAAPVAAAGAPSAPPAPLVHRLTADAVLGPRMAHPP